MKLPEKDAVHVFVLHSHITYLLSRGIVETYGLENIYAIHMRGYVPPVPDGFVRLTSPEMMKHIVSSGKRKTAYVLFSPEAKRFFNFSATEDFDDFYYVEEGMLSYKKAGGGLLGDHERLAGCFSVYDDAFPDFKSKTVSLGESIFSYFHYDMNAAGLLILEESKWMKDHRSYLFALKGFLQEYTQETHELPLLVSLRRSHDSKRETIDASLEMLDEFAVSYQELPSSIVKESLIYGSEMPVYYYQSSLGMYARKMGKNAICYK